MKHILFQLITGFTLGSICSIKSTKEVCKIVDYTVIHIFQNNRGKIVKATFKRPLWFLVTVRGINGATVAVGNKALKSIYKSDLEYSKIDKSLKTL